jgi:LysM domain
MALSLTSLYKPMNDFFLDLYGSPTGPIIFRFDKYGSVISDADFIDEAHPELGYQANLATEKFSALVDRVPVDTGDGMHVVLSEAGVDDAYFYRCLAPSMPQVPTGTDAQAVITNFSTVKQHALRVWESSNLVSSTGLRLDFWPALATPEDWYDLNNSASWTSQTLQVSGDGEPQKRDDRLWRLKLDDDRMRLVLKAVPAPAPARVNLPLLQATKAPELPRMVLMSRAARLDELQLDPARVSAAGMLRVAEPQPEVAPVDGGQFAIFHKAVTQTATLPLTERLLVTEYLAENAPTEPVQANTATVSFEYCLVHIGRPWYVDAFLRTPWWVPGVARGVITRADAPGGWFALPIGMVAVRRLEIRAEWTSTDTANASLASDFGPFKVQFDQVRGTLLHPGLQVVGWLLQPMPELPPADPPGTAMPGRTYMVQTGDTLWSIAVKLYGTGTRWPDIAAQNGIDDPTTVAVGMTLDIPD